MPDPGDPQALNRYSYVLNNPLRYTDPSGHCPFCIPIQQCFAGGPCQQVTNQLAQGAQSVWTQVHQLTVQYGPQVSSFIVQLINQYANQAAAAADGVRGPAGNAGNTAGPGGLGPNDPWGKFNSLLGQGKAEIDAAVEASIQGSGDRLVIGPYKTGPGVVNYIQEANGPIPGKYFDAGVKLWDQLAQKGIAGQVNRQVIYEQMKAGISRVDISSGMTIKQILADPTRYKSLTLEVGWIQEFAQIFGYVENVAGTGWVKP